VETIILLGDLHAMRGETRAAERQHRLAQTLLAAARARGVNTDLDGALFEADHATGQAGLDALVTRTRAAHARRPSVMADHVLAWVLYRAGHVNAASEAMTRALRLGTDDAAVLYHAGAIFGAAGHADRARALLHRSLARAGALSPRDATDAARIATALSPAHAESGR
jgi:hypothetical protein